MVAIEKASEMFNSLGLEKIQAGVKSKYVNRYATLFSVLWNLKRVRSDRDMLYKTVFNYAREYSQVIRNTELSERNIYTPEDIL